MSSQPNYCAHCGTRLVPGPAFCTSCGQRVAPVAAPPPIETTPPSPNPTQGPPPPPTAPPQSQAAPPPPAGAAPAAPRRPSSGKTKAAKTKSRSVGGAILLTLVGLLLVLMGVRGPVLQVAGATAAGVVTDVTRDTSSEDSDYDYNISYSFRTPDGKQHNGMTKRSSVLNTASLPGKGSSLRVRYLPAWPLLNTPSGEAELSIGSIVLFVLGLGLMVIAWRR